MPYYVCHFWILPSCRTLELNFFVHSWRRSEKDQRASHKCHSKYGYLRCSPSKTTVWQLEKEFSPLELKKSTHVLFPGQRCPSYSWLYMLLTRRPNSNTCLYTGCPRCILDAGRRSRPSIQHLWHQLQLTFWLQTS